MYFSRRCHVVVGTPGRIRQMVEEGHLSCNSVRLFCLDEADKMMEKSFKNDVIFVYNKLPSAKQVLALSATYPNKLANTLNGLMRNPQHVRLDENCQVLVGLDHYVIPTLFHPKPKFLLDLKFKKLLKILNSVTFSQVLVFVNYSINAETICDKLVASGWPAIYTAAALQDQYERLKVLTSLKQFATRILVTTDLSARGIDASNVTMVVHYDIPWDSRTFLHRCGRAGRFGSRGISICLASEGEEYNALRKTVCRTGTEIKILSEEIPDLWKLESPEDKNLVDELPVLEGIECEKEEEEDEHYKVAKETKENAEDSSQRKKGKNKRRTKRSKAEKEEVPEEPEIEDYEDCYDDEDYEDFYDYENGDEQYYEDELGDDFYEEEDGYFDSDPNAILSEKQDGGNELLTDEFIIESFETITGHKFERKNFVGHEMSIEQALDVVRNTMKSQSEPRPFTGFLGSKPSFEEVKKFAEKINRNRKKFDKLSEDSSVENMKEMLGEDFAEEITFIEKQRKALQEPVSADFDQDLVQMAVKTIADHEQRKWQAKVDQVTEQLEYSKFSLQEAVDHVIANGELPSLPNKMCAQIAEPESSSISPLLTPVKKPVKPTTTNTDESISIMPPWVPLAEHESVLETARGPVLYDQTETGASSLSTPISYEVSQAEGNAASHLFPDPDEGLGEYLDADSNKRQQLEKQFEDWWKKIQANKRLIAQNEFHTQMALAERKYGKRYDDQL